MVKGASQGSRVRSPGVAGTASNMVLDIATRAVIRVEVEKEHKFDL